MTSRLIIIIVLLALLAVASFAEVPQQVNYQGFMTSPDGSPLDTTVYMNFGLYAVPAGGLAFWVETHSSVVVSGGLFSVQLGSQGNPLSSLYFASDSVWLDISVGNNTGMTPRQRIAAVPYAHRVETVDGATGGTINGNLILSNGKINVGRGNSNAGAFANVLGDSCEARNDHDVVGGGQHNVARGYSSVVSGGQYNQATGGSSTIGGGRNNYATAGYSTVGGGDNNGAYNLYGTISGGRNNLALGEYTAIGGGRWNTAHDSCAVVAGGQYNKARGSFSVVAGGGGPLESDSNSAMGRCSAILGGRSNRAAGEGSTIGGGIGNSTATRGTIAGGMTNSITGVDGVIGGGNGNVASGSVSTIGGGESNTASLTYATVGGGFDNNATAMGSAIGGGYQNRASANYATVAGGFNNGSTGQYTSVVGGKDNTAGGLYSTVIGGLFNEANGDYSCAGGRSARATNSGSFVWSDQSTVNTFSSTASNQFNVRASGGVRMFTNSGTTLGAQLLPNATAWTALSDSAKKTDIRIVDTKIVLEKVAQLPIKEWRYKEQPDPSIRHIGPMAQDFWKQFHLGEDSLGISTIDPDGIALAAIQELAKENYKLQTSNLKLGQEIAELRAAVQSLLADKQQSQR